MNFITYVIRMHKYTEASLLFFIDFPKNKKKILLMIAMEFEGIHRNFHQ